MEGVRLQNLDLPQAWVLGEHKEVLAVVPCCQLGNLVPLRVKNVQK